MTNNNIGIISYGSYIPKQRIKLEDIAKKNNQNFEKIKSSLLIQEKSIPANDEDCATLATQAAINALEKTSINKKEIGALYIGSESHSYAVKPTSTIVGTALDIGNNYMSADLQFACKAGTAAMQICYGLVKSGLIKYGLAIGSDTAQAEPGDILEYSASAGAAAFIIGNDPHKIIASIDHTLSYTTDTADFWRRNHQKYPQHAGRFTGEPAYFKHVIESTEQILNKTKIKPSEIDYVVFHQPNGKFPFAVAKKLGFINKQIEPGIIANKIGNPYSASSPIALTQILNIAKPNQKILLTSYGSGSASDSFIFTTTDNIESLLK